jgi:cytochrome P450
VSLHPEMTRFTLRVIGRVLFGNDLTDLVPLVERHLPWLSGDVYRRAFTPVRPPRSWPTPGNRRPFGGGPRACIGAQLSLLEAGTVATVLREFRLDTPPGPVSVVPRITIHPAVPVPARLALRSG